MFEEGCKNCPLHLHFPVIRMSSVRSEVDSGGVERFVTGSGPADGSKSLHLGGHRPGLGLPELTLRDKCLLTFALDTDCT